MKKAEDFVSPPTKGLIRELKKLCSPAAGEWLYYGATVQDITDTWLAMALLKVWGIVWRHLDLKPASPCKKPS